jgi:hypothetical protein
VNIFIGEVRAVVNKSSDGEREGSVYALKSGVGVWEKLLVTSTSDVRRDWKES